MKMRKKAALAAVMFSAALNTACAVYGPPAEEQEKNDTEIVSSDGTAQTDAEDGTDASDDSEGDEQQ